MNNGDTQYLAVYRSIPRGVVWADTVIGIASRSFVCPETAYRHLVEGVKLGDVSRRKSGRTYYYWRSIK